MDHQNLSDIVSSLKTHLEENDGELGYWGDRVAMSQTEKVLSPPSAAVRLESLRSETIGDCQRCPLARTRTKLVFGVGNPQSPVMFVGEGPGYDEDKVGEPFVGKAGQLLDRIMASVGLNRTNSYIANIVKCHPLVDPTQPDKRGNDRPPAPEEIETCFQFLKNQISIINPKIIVALGATAARTLLRRSAGITQLRGQIAEVQIIEDHPPFPVLPTFHPAALLRDENLKRPVWEDMKKLRTYLDTVI